MMRSPTRPPAGDRPLHAYPSRLPPAALAAGGLWEVHTNLGTVRCNDPASGSPATDGLPKGSVGARDIIEVFDRAIARLKVLRALEPQDCYLCGAWLPWSDDSPAGHQIECTGCGAVYVNRGRWQRILDARDAQNPYHSALYMRRYGYDADYIQHLGWVVPPAELLVRFPGESAAAKATAADQAADPTPQADPGGRGEGTADRAPTVSRDDIGAQPPEWSPSKPSPTWRLSTPSSWSRSDSGTRQPPITEQPTSRWQPTWLRRV
jgi:hypothetical protein